VNRRNTASNSSQLKGFRLLHTTARRSDFAAAIARASEKSNPEKSIMKRNSNKLALAFMLLATAGSAHAQFASTGTGNVSVNIGAEAAIRIDTPNLTLTSSGTNFSDYTGTTGFTYMIRTSAGSGTGSITLKVTTDFSGTGGPSVATPPTAGDTLSYTCTVASPGTASSGSAASTTGNTGVGTFGAGASSSKTGNTGSVSWNLTNDPAYKTGSYTAVVTYTIQAL
jgi:hypothetical protein